MKYTDYDIEDFLNDEFFVNWVKQPEGETAHFWVKWLEENPEKRKTIQRAREMILLINYEKRYEMVEEHYVEMFENIIGKKHSEDAEIKPNWIKRWFSIAAIVTLAFGSIYLFRHFQMQQEVSTIQEQTMVTMENPWGRKSTVKLPDGTVVYLNAGSSLTFPEQFGETERTVSLEGEAFFEVKKDVTKPFKVEMDGHAIMVTGTTFNASNRELFTVSLISGSVKVEDTSGNSIIMSPNQMVVKGTDGNFQSYPFDPIKVTGWKDNYLVFDGDGFDSFLSKISQWYGVEVTVTGDAGKNWSYSGIYHKESLQNVLEGVSLTSGFTYEIKGKQVLLYNPK